MHDPVSHFHSIFFLFNEKSPHSPAVIWWNFGGKYFGRAASRGLDLVGFGLKIWSGAN